jgi:hypothetical protein
LANTQSQAKVSQPALDVSSLGIDWKQNGQTLILALSSNCHFCTNSAPFYTKLVQKKGSTRLVAVLPQPEGEGRKYLEKLGVSVDEVRQLSPDRIGVRGTPTLILVDASGGIRSSWVGLLPPNAEMEVLGKLK